MTPTPKTEALPLRVPASETFEQSLIAVALMAVVILVVALLLVML